MNCPSGHPNADGMAFCTQCGMRIVVNPTVGPSQPYVQPTNPANPFDSVAPMWPNHAAQFQPVSQPPKDNSKRNIAIISMVSTLAAVLLVFFVASNRSSGPSAVLVPEEEVPATRTVTVSLTVMNGLDGCDLPFGYFDIPGAQFELRADGEIVGFGSYPSSGLDLTYGCKFSSTVFDVPADAEIYSVSLASGRRGTIYNTQADLAGNNWEFALSLGDS